MTFFHVLWELTISITSLQESEYYVYFNCCGYKTINYFYRVCVCVCVCVTSKSVNIASVVICVGHDLVAISHLNMNQLEGRLNGT